MAEIPPHITIADHMLRLVDFEWLPGSQLYALTEPARDPTRRGQQAVQSLRAAQYSVTSDAAYDLKPATPLHGDQGVLDRQENNPVSEALGGGQTVFASTHVLYADIRAAQIVVHDQVRDPDGTLRAVGTDMRTREGVLLHGEGDLRYVETRLDNTSLAFEAFSYIRGNGRPDPTPSTRQRRAKAAVAISPARAGASVPRRPDVAAVYRPPVAAQQPAHAR